SRWHVERTNRCFYKVWRKSRAIVREVIWEIRVNTPRTLRVNSSFSGSTQDVIIGASLSLGTFQFFAKPLHLTVGNDLTVLSGSTLNVRFGSDVVVTSELSSRGQINVIGTGATLNVSTGSTEIDAGSMNVTAGGVVQTGLANIEGFSLVTVSGAGSQWINTTMRVGQFGNGTLNIADGGMVQSSSSVIGRFSDAVGVVTVSGANSQWNNSSLTVGFEGSGTLNVTGGGNVSSADGILGARAGSDGTATVTGGTWTMTGRLLVGGEPVFGASGGEGTLNIQPAGTVSAAQGVEIFPQGLVRLQGGTLDASAVSFDGAGGQFQWTSGTLHVGTFNGNLVNSSGTLAPGHSPGSTTVNGNYTQQSGGALEIEIGGPLAGSEFDFVNVTGSALLDGELDLTLTGGFTPTPSQTFAILIAGSLSGAFDNAPSGQRVTTSDGGGSFLINYGVGSPFDDNQVVLSNFLAGGTSGDFDNDGDVDGRDFLIWQRGGSPTPFSAGDLADWQMNYGVGPLVAASTAVPEPDCLGYLAFVTLAVCARSRRDGVWSKK
ncbi:MAG: hypothetical protein SH868_08655, partial [Bythopirellula sp.]|nr:hypothetical protein [Bythopirellula sp.]